MIGDAVFDNSQFDKYLAMSFFPFYPVCLFVRTPSGDCADYVSRMSLGGVRQSRSDPILAIKQRRYSRRPQSLSSSITVPCVFEHHEADDTRETEMKTRSILLVQTAFLWCFDDFA